MPPKAMSASYTSGYSKLVSETCSPQGIVALPLFPFAFSSFSEMIKTPPGAKTEFPSTKTNKQTKNPERQYDKEERKSDGLKLKPLLHYLLAVKH